MLIILAKFLHSSPALGFEQLEHAQYMVSMCAMTPEFDAEKMSTAAQKLPKASRETSVGVHIPLPNETSRDLTTTSMITYYNSPQL